MAWTDILSTFWQKNQEATQFRFEMICLLCFLLQHDKKGNHGNFPVAQSWKFQSAGFRKVVPPDSKRPWVPPRVTKPLETGGIFSATARILKTFKRQRSGILSNDRKTIIIRSCQEFLCFHFGWSAVTLESPTKPSLIFIDEQIQVDPIQNGKNTISIQTEIKGFAWLFTADINELNHKRNRSTAGKKRS